MLKIHFLNVGHGDCCIIEFPDRLTVIDINRTSSMDEQSQDEILFESMEFGKALSAQYQVQIGNKKKEQVLLEAGYNISLTDPISYIKKLGASSIFRFISTHPHMDYLSGLYNLSQEFHIQNIWVVNNDIIQKDLPESEQQDWDTYCKYRDAKQPNASGITCISPLEGDSNIYWKDDGIYILAPNNDLLKSAKDSGEPNDMSYVLLIKYGRCKIVLGGDAESKTWSYLVGQYENELKDVSILKASHHGRDTGYYQPAVKLMNPVVTVVSVGKKPSTDVSNKYRQYCDNVLSTRWKGNIVFECNQNGNISAIVEHDR